MPVGTRLRTNSVFGTTLDSPLTAGALTFTSAALAIVPIVAGNHFIVTLDPLRQYGEPEIVIITSHTSGATVASITRASYGTIARTHPAGTVWVHAPLVEDVTVITTSVARPTDPYRGQMIFETDTNSFVARTATDVWQTLVQFGAWIAWTPTITGMSGGTAVAKYTRIGRTIHYRFRYTLAGAGMSTVPSFTLPVAPHAEYVVGDAAMGKGALIDTGTIRYGAAATLTNTSTVTITYDGAPSDPVIFSPISATAPFTWGTGDAVMITGTYEAVS